MFERIEKYFFNLVSILFHPIFVPFYAINLLIFTYSQYVIFNQKSVFLFIALFFIVTIFLPVLIMMLMYYFRLLSSLTLKTKEERLMVSSVMLMFYFFLFFLLRNAEFPEFIKIFLFALPFILLGLLIFQWFYYTISMHMYALCSVVGMLIFYKLQMNIIAPFVWVFVLCFAVGLTATARLVTLSHNYKDIILGSVSGLVFSFVVFLVSKYL